MPCSNLRASCSPVTRAIVGLGTNLGARRALLLGALHALSARPGLSVLARSRLYETPPLGPPQPDFLNAAILVQWSGSALGLLSELHAVERLLGRERRERWGPRTIDLDLLWWEDGGIDEPALQVPHPGLPVRNFALAPLLDVLPELAGEFASRLAELGGPPPITRWPVLETVLEASTVGQVQDDAELASLLVSSVFAQRRDVIPRASLPFQFQAGDTESSVRALGEGAARAGFAATWACITQVGPAGQQSGVYLGQPLPGDAPPRLSLAQVTRGAESLAGMVRVDRFA